jgi:hypothetical protein
MGPTAVGDILVELTAILPVGLRPAIGIQSFGPILPSKVTENHEFMRRELVRGRFRVASG